MCKVQTLRAFVKQRLSAAAEEIMELFERTLREYEDEIHTHNKLLHAVLKPRVHLHRADVQQVLVSNEEFPTEQQERSHSLDQEEPPELPDTIEEEGQLRSSQEGEQLGGLEEADITEFTPVHGKSEEDDEGKPPSSQLHQSQTEENEDAPARNLNPDHLQPGADDEKSHSSEPETDDSCDWEDVREPEWGLNSLQNNEVSVSDVGCNTGRKPVSSSECATSSGHTEGRLRPLTCSVCGKKCRSKNTLISHMKVHLKGHSSICSVCNKSFRCRAILVAHVRIHTGEKPYSCIFCSRRFAQKSHLKRHSHVHAKEKPFSCSLCSKRFTMRSSVKRHMKIHTKERPPRRYSRRK